jgi:trimeric autotransporter adhesin
MPLCPQITNTPITVSLTSDFTVTNVVPVLAANTEQLAATDANVAAAVATANAAAATAGTAQSTANTALANAATAYSAAIGSLQPSASTIVNASNQMTAIAANGITVYSGASASSGARVVLNSLGLAGFNSGGTATFSISASTGAAVFSGSVTGSTITGGTLNIAGNAIIDSSGLLTATGATITGTINATAGYFGTVSNGWSISSTGLVGVGTGTIVTSTGSNAIVLSSTDNAIGIKSGGAYAGWIGSIGSGAILMHYGTSPSSSLYPRAAMSSTAGTLSGTASSGFSANTDGTNTISGGSRFLNTAQVDGTLTTNSITAGVGSAQFDYLSSSGTLRSPFTYSVARTASTRTMIIDSSGNFGTTASTRRKKHEIESYKIDSNALLNLDVKTFKYKPEFDSDQQIQHGFIAEEAQELGLDELIQYDSTGVPDYFAYEKLPIFLLQLAQEQEARIQALEGK